MDFGIGNLKARDTPSLVRFIQDSIRVRRRVAPALTSVNLSTFVATLTQRSIDIYFLFIRNFLFLLSESGFSAIDAPRDHGVTLYSTFFGTHCAQWKSIVSL